LSLRHGPWPFVVDELLMKPMEVVRKDERLDRE
jgi:hypothetical protein